MPFWPDAPGLGAPLGPLPPPSRLWVAVGSWEVAFDVELPLDELLPFDEELEEPELEAAELVPVAVWLWLLESEPEEELTWVDPELEDDYSAGRRTSEVIYMHQKGLRGTYL